jgi:hypothetical protein
MIFGHLMGSPPPPPPPPPPVQAICTWTGTVPENVAGASGQSVGYFSLSSSGGYTPNNNVVTITYNPTGKLSLVNVVGSSFAVAYSGLNLNEVAAITVQVDTTDSHGNGSSASESTVLKRTS